MSTPTSPLPFSPNSSRFIPPISPLKGFQKISDELRREREKTTEAMQERARLRIELQAMKQRMEGVMNEADEAKRRASISEDDKHQLRGRIEELEYLSDQQQKEISDMELKNNESYRNIDQEIRIRMDLETEAEQCRVDARRSQVNAEEAEQLLQQSQSMIGKYECVCLIYMISIICIIILFVLFVYIDSMCNIMI